MFSKTTGRVIAKQSFAYLTLHKIPNQLQSAYLLNKSTETALSKIISDLLSKLDNSTDTILVLLDLSAAFDTLNHTILLTDSLK